MKERGMIFNGEMVRAIIDCRKTQTRRIVKGTDGAVKFCKEWDINGEEIFVVLGEKDHTGMNPVLGAISCPFGGVGDRIWVRETWSDVNLEGIQAVAYRADGDVYSLMDDESFLDEDGAFNYDDPRVTKYHFAAWYSDLIGGIEGDWRPSIHMPRWASRILLEITNVRVERLKSISDGDAVREGCSTADMMSGDCVADVFARLWASIYGQESWNANPWVWVIEFKRVEGGTA
ncbi:TPA: morphogenetic protein [Klebsiella pneumoniae]|nr:morphogenetic protein [Klebsiella pneumoniae]HBT8357406.1 morphogenetic protein [Klebsiella pneumoniae]HBT8903681.1 morphogenetic protein [Klebsiella pneumoniae]HBT9958248.1 morphogenetic protein [Klebsiella pneumoniae]HBU0235313.1 morphogenetic protein [Klebsiella pneumoniae]